MKNISLAFVLFIGCTNVFAQPCTTPFAKFGISPNSGHCRGSIISFIDSSFIANDAITGYTWYFGDGGNSTLQNPEHVYFTAGTYTISQFVYTALGCVDTFYASYTIYADPVADFIYMANAPGSKTIQFTDLSTSTAGYITGRQWDFGDLSGISTLANPTHTYALTGNYPAVLKVTSSNGCTSNFLTKMVAVDTVPATCAAAFTISGNNACFGLPVSFISTFADSVVKAIWDLGDGRHDTILNNPNSFVSNTYANPGNYNVSYTIYKTNGCSSTSTQVATVQPKPEADFVFTATPTCSSPWDVQFTSTATISSGSVNAASTSWNFDDGAGTGSGSGPNPLYSFVNPGIYNVRMIARSTTYNCRDTVFKPFVTFRKPVAAFTYAPDTGNTRVIHFTDASNSPTSPIVSWFWDFGDGSTSTEQHPVHTYNLFGNFTVRHSCISAMNCKSDTTVDVVYTNAVIEGPANPFESSMGKEFWAGFGYQEKMARRAGDAGEAKLSLIIVAGSQPATVTVSMPGINAANGFPRTINIPANGVAEVTNFPTGDPADMFNPMGMPDARLYYTGVSKRGIHVTSSQPIGVWQSIYASNNSAGGSLLLPVNVWGNDYQVQAMGGTSNISNPNSFFFVMAKEDSTDIAFTPAANIIDSSFATLFTSGHSAANVLYQAGSTYTIRLNKGDVFNAMGIITGSGTNSAIGADLSGSRIKTLDPLKKIAVFAGNGRVLIKPAACPGLVTGSDNLVQQMFPKTVWGTKYITTPTKTLENNMFRVTVADTSTVVSVNGNILPSSTLVNGQYYQFETYAPAVITATRRVMVVQYITSPGCLPATYGQGYGDPEMIILSPLKYGIKSTTVYTMPIRNSSTDVAHFINVVVPTPAVASFDIDGLLLVDTGRSSFMPVPIPYQAGSLIPTANAFRIMDGDPAYSFARFRVAGNSVHRLQCDSAFTAIVYGLGNGESYGYNAGFTTNFAYTSYTFTGTGNWDIPDNWQDNRMPPAILPMGSEIIVRGNASLNVPQVIEDGAMLTVMAGGNLTVAGSLLVWE